jgi:hypothetical protein
LGLSATRCAQAALATEPQPRTARFGQHQAAFGRYAAIDGQGRLQQARPRLRHARLYLSCTEVVGCARFFAATMHSAECKMELSQAKKRVEINGLPAAGLYVQSLHVES